MYFGKRQVFLEWPHNLFSFQCGADARLVYIIVHHNTVLEAFSPLLYNYSHNLKEKINEVFSKWVSLMAPAIITNH